MKHSSLYIALILLCFSCAKEDAPDCFQPTGDLTTTPIEVTQDIHSIELHDNIILKLENAPTDVSFGFLTGGEYLLSDIEITEEDGMLTFRNNNSCNWVREQSEFTVEINSNHITHITNWGSSGVEIRDYHQGFIEFNQWQSIADNLIMVNTDSVIVNLHAGAGTALVTGESEYSQLYTNGTCRIATPEFICNKAVINNSGINDILASSETELNIYIGSSGNVIYNSFPSVLNIQSEGTGEVYYDDF